MQQQQQQHYTYGQVVVGPCGSGKTTYCNGIQQYLQLLGRNVMVVNFDPANHYLTDAEEEEENDDDDTVKDTDGLTTIISSTVKKNYNSNNSNNNKNTALPYTAIYDVCVDAVNIKSVMKQLNLGPNGALIYCMEYIELHIDEIIQTIRSRTQQQQLFNNSNSSSSSSSSSSNSSSIVPVYYIFDFPGQVELYTHSTCVQSILQRIMTQLQTKLVVVQLIDALYCTDVTKFISAALLGTTTMIRLELPTVSVLSKVDLLTSYNGTQQSSSVTSPTLPLQLDYYTDCYDLERLIPFLYQTNHTNENDDFIFDDDPSTAVVPDDDEYRHHHHSLSSYNDDIMDDPDYQRIVQKRRSTKFNQQYERLHHVLAEIVDDYSLLSFIPLDINNAQSVGRVLAKIDKCNGYVVPSSSSSTTTTKRTDHHSKQQQQPHPTSTNNDQYYQDLFQCAIQADGNGSHQNMYESFADIRERMASPESIRELRNNNKNNKKKKKDPNSK